MLCSLEAIITPVPYMSSASAMMSPTLMPMRKTMRRPSGTSRFDFEDFSWISKAHFTASTVLLNSISAPSPVSLTTRPW